MLHRVQINNAGAIMSQRDINAEGLEKSFATNVLGESSVRVTTTLMGKRDGDGYAGFFFFFVLMFYSVCLSSRSLHSHQESHSPSGEERRPQSGEIEIKPSQAPHFT